MSEIERPDRAIPANIEAERAVLGSLMIDPDAIIKVANFLRPEDFFRERHAWLYEAMRTLNERREPLDFVTIVDELERRERLEEIGGPAYLTDLIASTPTALYVDHYARIVERTAVLRRLIAAAGKIAELAYDESQEVDEVVDRAEQIIFGISESRIHRDLTPIRAIMSRVVDRIDFLSRNQDTLMGVPTGFTMLDRLLGGLQKSDLVILAARPAMGKCVAAGTRLLNPHTGELMPIEDLVQTRHAPLLTLNADYKLVASEASDFIDDGVKPVYLVRTALGREIKVTLTHPFLTIQGWRPLGELQVGDHVAVPRILPVFGTCDAPEEQQGTLPMAAEKFGATRTQEADTSIFREGLTGRSCQPNRPSRKMVDKTPVFPVSQRFVPAEVFTYTRSSLALFLHCLFACDSSLHRQEQQGASIVYSTACKQLAHDVQHLLLRFGIIAKLCPRLIKDNDSHHTAYELQITDAQSLQHFCTEIGTLGEEEGFARVLPQTQSSNGQIKNDIYWDEITAIDYLGEQQVYDLTVPETHNFIADDMLVHNTSFCLSIAQNAAKRHGTRVAFFSLEMSNDQLVQRLLAMETGIDSHRLRLGNIHEEEWPILLEAANMLANTHIFIDDTPAASVNDIRTKARRLYAEDGIDLIIIDYMQLMTGQSGGSGRNENRQQEISYISRSLKTLARELNVPVIALSQLSRAVESRSDKRPMLSDLRESGCLTGETLVTLANGEYQPIASLVGKQGFDVFALNTTTGQLEKSAVSRAFCTGTKPVYKLTTEQGRIIRATANHPFLTAEGWKRLDKLQVREQIVSTASRLRLGSLQPTGMWTRNFQKSNVDFVCHPERVSVAQYPEDPTRVTDASPQVKKVWGNRVDSACHPERVSVAQYPEDPARVTDASSRFMKNSVHVIPMDHTIRAGGTKQDTTWDTITGIEADGTEPVYDLTVPGNHNFVANDIIVHNSIEQDADVVLFIYREDYYIEDTDRQNIADILVTKHRHGATGTVSLYFRKELTQFRDLEIQRTELDY